jgi:hypothetical protein
VFWWGVTWTPTRSCLPKFALTHVASRLRVQCRQASTLLPYSTTPTAAAMEDTTMLDGSQGPFEELTFTIIPNGLSEDRMRQVRDASGQLRSVTNTPNRSKMILEAHAERSYPSTHLKAA